MPIVEVPGAQLSYDVAGDPTHPAVLFVHAGVATRAMWDPQFDDLARDHYVIRYDTRGYGESPGEDIEFADRHDLIAVLDALDVSRATYVGASRGGRIAVDAALDEPDRVTGLVTIRLDYALGTHRVASAIITGGYEQFHFRFHTDHRAFFMDFSTEGLFGSPTQQLAKMVERGLHSRNVKQVTHYIAEKHKMLTASNVFVRIEKLKLPGNRHRFAEKLDADVVFRSLSAEKRTSKYRTPLWSIKLIEARTKVSILSKYLTMLKLGINLHQIISEEMTKMTEQFPLPSSVSECNGLLRLAKREVANIIEHSFEVRDREPRSTDQSIRRRYRPDQ